jgi:hypothetical protein
VAPFLNFNTLIEFMLGISLSAAAGFRVFVPLLALSAAAVLGHVDLPANFDWIENPQALGLFAIACVLEIIGYSIPWADHLLDILATPAAIAAGTIVAASSTSALNPLAQWTIALVVGGGTAGITKGLLNILRGTSTLATGGLANPLFAAVELLIAMLLSALAITVPLGAIGLLITILGGVSYNVWKRVRRSTASPAASPNKTT